jgi:hypothetical protein
MVVLLVFAVFHTPRQAAGTGKIKHSLETESHATITFRDSKTSKKSSKASPKGIPDADRLHCRKQSRESVWLEPCLTGRFLVLPCFFAFLPGAAPLCFRQTPRTSP